MSSYDINSDFYAKASQIIDSLSQDATRDSSFPQRIYSDNGDEFYSRLWQYIDESQRYCWILTYAMDSSLPANITLRKLANAAKRGVDVVLLVDDLQQYTNKRMVNRLSNSGGRFVSLNPTWSRFWHIPTQEFFRRHHEKLMIIDDHAIIGSANLEASYGGAKYGTQTFYDMNLITSGNVNVKNFMAHFHSTAQLYNIELKEHEIEGNPLPPYFKLIRTHQPAVREIQDHILTSIINAKHKIVMVQPYYYPIRIFEDEIIRAMDRGVKVELITSAKRDQPVYHYLKNYLLFRKILHPNLQLFEYPEQLLHMKGYLIDDEVFNIGSFNNDRWSWKLNNEVNIVSTDLTEAQSFKSVIERCKEYSLPVKPQGSVWPWRYTKIKFWELFLYLSEIMMSKNKGSHLDKYRYKRIAQDWDESLGNDF